MTGQNTNNLSDAIRNLIVCDTQFGWTGETTLKLPELLDLQARGWLIEGDDNCEFSLTDEGQAVVARALQQDAPAELAEQQGDSPIDVTDPWRGLYQASRLRAPTEYGDTFHPDIPCWPDDREYALDKLVRAQGFDFHIVAGDFTEAALEDGDDLYWQEMRAWNPEAPEGEWRLAWKGDTEDGPYAWFVRPMALRPEPATPPAQGIDLVPRPMDTAPRDGTMVRLLVQFTEHATEDTDGPSWTIGANNGEHDGGDLWCFAGWCWTHDHFTEGKGTPVGWLPLIDGQLDAAPGVDRG